MTFDITTRIGDAPGWVDEVAYELRCAHCRSIVRLVRETSTASVDDVVTEIERAQARPPPVKTLRTQLYHACMPCLESVGLLSVDGQHMEPGDRDLLESSVVAQIAACESTTVNDIIGAIANPMTRRVLAVLEADADRTDLASLVEGVDPEDPEDLRHQLHHQHLPQLQHADLLEYAPAHHHRVQYFGDPLVEELLEAIAETVPEEP